MITTTITWQDLQESLDEELDELREAYEEIVEAAREEFGEDALRHDLPDDPDQLSEDRERLWTYQMQAESYNAAAKSIQKRKHLLDNLEDEYGSGSFEIKMLSGEETMEIEEELKMRSQTSDDNSSLEAHRNRLTTDVAVVDAPEDVPRDEEGSPKISECPDGLALALWEQVESLNNAGETGFRAEGFDALE